MKNAASTHLLCAPAVLSSGAALDLILVRIPLDLCSPWIVAIHFFVCFDGTGLTGCVCFPRVRPNATYLLADVPSSCAKIATLHSCKAI
jgi:hypothetical protein